MFPLVGICTVLGIVTHLASVYMVSHAATEDAAVEAAEEAADLDDCWVQQVLQQSILSASDKVAHCASACVS